MPFGRYKDFADCVRKNADKENPQAYCAAIQRKAEGKQAGQSTEADVESGATETPPRVRTGWWKGHL